MSTRHNNKFVSCQYIFTNCDRYRSRYKCAQAPPNKLEEKSVNNNINADNAQFR